MTLTQDRRAELLAGCPLFRGIDQAGPGRPRRASRRAVDFPAGHVIARQGEIGTGFFVVIDGWSAWCATARWSPGSAPGEFFGELSVLDRMPRNASVIAEAPTSCLALASWDFEQVLLEQPALTLSVLRGVATACATPPSRRGTEAGRVATGTLTFLFSDIEGSTRLLDALGQRRATRPSSSARRRSCGARSRATAGARRAPRATRSSWSSTAPARPLRGGDRGPARARRRGLAGRRRGPRADGPARRRGDGLGGGARRHRHQPGGAHRGRRARRPDRGVRGGALAGRRRTSGPEISLRGLGNHRLKDLREPQPLSQVVADGLRARVPAAPLARRPAEQPADAAHLVRRPRAGARPRPGALLAAEPARDAHRPRRHRQDAALAPGRGERRRRVPGRHLLRAPSRPSATRRSCRRASPPRSASPSRRGGPRPRSWCEWLERQARPARPRQLRAGRWRRARSSPTCCATRPA